MRLYKVVFLLLIMILLAGCKKSEEDKKFIIERIDWDQNGLEDLLIHYDEKANSFDVQNFCIYRAEDDNKCKVTELPSGRLIYDEENQRLYAQVDPEGAHYKYEAYQIADYDVKWDKTMSVMGDERQTIYTVWNRQQSIGMEAHYLNRLTEEEQAYWESVIPK